MFSTRSCTTLVYPDIYLVQATYPTHVVHIAVTHNCHLCSAVSAKNFKGVVEGRKERRTYVKPGDVQVVLELPEISATAEDMDVRATDEIRKKTHSESSTPELKISFANIVP
jgi:hypothetical protein